MSSRVTPRINCVQHLLNTPSYPTSITFSNWEMSHAPFCPQVTESYVDGKLSHSYPGGESFENICVNP